MSGARELAEVPGTSAKLLRSVVSFEAKTRERGRAESHWTARIFLVRLRSGGTVLAAGRERPVRCHAVGGFGTLRRVGRAWRKGAGFR